MAIVGRVKEQDSFNQYLESEKSELVAVYGRRRVGKTFLIKEFFKEQFSFYISGLPNSNKDEQLENFATTLTFYGKMPYPKVNSWLEAFRQLIYMLENSRKKSKKVVFIDELPQFAVACKTSVGHNVQIMNYLRSEKALPRVGRNVQIMNYLRSAKAPLSSG